jgi:hypothetical protein
MIRRHRPIWTDSTLLVPDQPVHHPSADGEPVGRSLNGHQLPRSLSIIHLNTNATGLTTEVTPSGWFQPVGGSAQSSGLDGFHAWSSICGKAGHATGYSTSGLRPRKLRVISTVVQRERA